MYYGNVKSECVLSKFCALDSVFREKFTQFQRKSCLIAELSIFKNISVFCTVLLTACACSFFDAIIINNKHGRRSCFNLSIQTAEMMQGLKISQQAMDTVRLK